MRVALTVLLLASSLPAQSKVDFSGIYLRIETWFRGKSTPAIPRILDIKQTSAEVLVTGIQNRETAEVRYHLAEGKKQKADARISGDKFFIKTTGFVQLPSFEPFGMPWRIPQVVEEKWELSPDGNQLKIHRKYSGSSEDIDIYTREPSRDAALAAAAAKNTTGCSEGEALASLKRQVSGDRTYKQGYELGMVSIRRITKCVTYDLALSGDFFKQLRQIRDSQGMHFVRGDQVTTAFDGDLVLEVGPRPYECVGEAGQWLSSGEPPESSLDLRFKVRWLGSAERDLDEVRSESRYEPWREWSNPVMFYRMRIPAHNIPLTDELEVMVFTKNGEQLACVKGHL